MKITYLVLLICVLSVTAINRNKPTKKLSRNIKHELYRGGRAKADYVLPESVWPISYDVQIIPYLDEIVGKEFTFEGVVISQLNVTSDTSKIVMHTWDLVVNSISISQSNGSQIIVMDWTYSTNDTQFFQINLASSLRTGNQYTMTIDYTGIIQPQDDAYGLYRYSFLNPTSGKNEWMAVTDLEPTGARRIVPWFDQPTFKAPITLTVAKAPGRKITANMPILSQTEPVPNLPGWVWVKFNPTPPMSTYLFSFSVHNLTAIVHPDTRFSILTRSTESADAMYALDTTASVVDYFSAALGVDYPLPKLDGLGLLVFTSGGMENWGLITYRESYIVYNPLKHTIWDKKWTATLVAHEVAHQWFGDLVSPVWWSNLWLNEGFATYLEAHWPQWTTAQNWELDKQFLVDYIQSAMRSDASPSTHPIYADVDSPNSISSIFDNISYNKAGSVIRFMQKLLGETNFRLALNNYLTTMGNKAADQSDLFAAMSPYAPPLPNGVTFPSMMDTWTKQAGFPVVTVTRDYNARTATFTQERFATVSSEEWVIPLFMTNAANPNFNTLSANAWLLPGQNNLVVSDTSIIPSNVQWLIVNVQQAGFFRVNYDQQNWDMIAAYMETPGGANVIAEENRAAFMDDALALAKLNRLNYNTALRTTSYLNFETKLTPWLTATNNLEFFRDRMYTDLTGAQLFQSYIRNRISNVYAQVRGFSSNSSVDTPAVYSLRWEITRWACNNEYDTCNNDGVQLFRLWQTEPQPDVNNPIEIDLRTPAYCAGQRRGGQADYDFIIARYNAATISDERERLLLALGCASSTILLQQFLTDSLNSNVIAANDAVTAVEAVSGNPLDGANLALDFIIANWQALDTIYGNIGVGFIAIAEKLNTQGQYNKIVQFRSDHLSELSASALTLITNTLNTLQETIDWNFQHYNTVYNYFLSA